MKWFFVLILLGLGAQFTTFGQSSEGLDSETEAKALACLQRGANYLINTQHKDGAWEPAPRTAIAALCVTALHASPASADTRDAAIDRAMGFVLQRAQEDGAITSKATTHYLIFSDDGYPTYTTAVALLAMATLQRPEDVPYMQQAREFLKNVQVTGSGDGGFGYKADSRADLSNSAWVAEAMYYSSYVEMEPYTVSKESQEATVAMWDKLNNFLEEAQNSPERGNAAGFGYRPGKSSTGSMSYAGLKSMIYANVDRNDPRVVEVLNYLRETYSVDENAGQGTRGLYYHLQVMAKALDLLGSDTFILDDGAKREWRKDLIDKLASTQQADGSWQNENGRYMESVKPLVTAYAMITLKKALNIRVQPSN